MTKRMLIDATHSEETRVVVADNDRLLDYEYESAMRKQLRGNIFLAKVTRVEPSLQAAFVNFGGNRHGFLPFSEIHTDYYRVPIADREALLEEQRKAIEEARRLEEEEDAELEEAENEDISDDGEDIDEEDDVQEVGGENVPISEEEDEIEEASSSEVEDSADPEEVSSDEQKQGRGRGRYRRGRGKFRRGGRNRAAYDSRKVEIVGGDHIEGDHPIRPNLTRRYKIQEVIKRGQIMLVQASKEERGNKGAAVTTYLSLPGRYCVLMPNSPRSGGVSRKIANYKDRKRLREILKEFNLPDGMSVIVRTAGVERTKVEIKRDLDYLLRLWDSIRSTTLESQAPALIYEEGELVKRSIRDIYTRDIDEVVVQGERGYKTARDIMKMMIPSHVKRVKEYKDQPVSLFQKHKLEQQISGIGDPSVPLKSGGYLVIHPTEALVSIDVNSGRATKERHIEETALRTNMEAAEEVARQLKLRDLGGLIVIDFIDMEDRRNNAKVERKLKEALSNDRARIQVGRISSFGLMELSRQRISASVTETQFRKCPHCEGVGHIRTTDSMAIVVLRALETEALNGQAAEVSVTVTPEVALYILNNKRAKLVEIETRTGLKIFIRSDENAVPSAFEIDVLKTQKELAKELAKENEISLDDDEGRQEVDEIAEAGEDNTDAGKKRNRRGRRGGRNRGGKSRDQQETRSDQAVIDKEGPAQKTEPDDQSGKEESLPAQSEEKPKTKPGRKPKKTSAKAGDEEVSAKKETTDSAASKESQPKPKRGRKKADDASKETDHKKQATSKAAASKKSAKAPEKIDQSEPSNENAHAKDFEVVNEAPKTKKKGWWNKLVE